MPERCDLTDLLPADCACAKHRNLPDPLVEPRTAGHSGDGIGGPWFPARFGGRCTNCDTEFEAGENIRADGEGGYLGACCGSDV